MDCAGRAIKKTMKARLRSNAGWPGPDSRGQGASCTSTSDLDASAQNVRSNDDGLAELVC